MEIKDFLILISKKKQTIISLTILFLVLTALFTAVQPMKYGSSEKMLVVQNFPSGGDAYSFSKSNEYLSNLLAEVVTSNSFFDKVMDSGFKIDKTYFDGTTKQKMKKWSKTVEAKAVNDSGIIEITTYHTDRSQAEQLALAVAYTMKTSHQYYHGGGNDVIIKIIDEPITSNWPVKPNAILNLSLALVFGLVFSLCYIYLFPDEKYNFRLWREKKKFSAQGIMNSANFDDKIKYPKTNELGNLSVGKMNAQILQQPDKLVLKEKQPVVERNISSINQEVPAPPVIKINDISEIRGDINNLF